MFLFRVYLIGCTDSNLQDQLVEARQQLQTALDQKAQISAELSKVKKLSAAYAKENKK